MTLPMNVLALVLCCATLCIASEPKTEEFKLPTPPSASKDAAKRPVERVKDKNVVEFTNEVREHLKHAIKEINGNVSEIEDEQEELNCGESSPDNEEKCKQLEKKLKEIKRIRSIFLGAGYVDDEVHKENLDGKEAAEERKKREAALEEISAELMPLAEEQGLHKKDIERPADLDAQFAKIRNKRACSHRCHGCTLRAANSRHTIESSVGGGAGVFISASLAAGHAYGQHGRVGNIWSRCWGFETNIGISAGVAEGYYNTFDDVKGQSKVFTFTAGWGPWAYTWGEIKSGGRKIGHISGFSGGWSWLPISIGSFSCKTDMNECNRCTIGQESFQQRYYTGCGWWGLGRCTRHRTAYKRKVNC
eukprot:m.4030 g.4030  ORF g.4030 m.4030 type:complete len:362 (+) comp10091_c0_seq2:238-1323(+)